MLCRISRTSNHKNITILQLIVNTTANELNNYFWDTQVAYIQEEEGKFFEIHICDLRMDTTFAVWRLRFYYFESEGPQNRNWAVLRLTGS